MGISNPPVTTGLDAQHVTTTGGNKNDVWTVCHAGI